MMLAVIVSLVALPLLQVDVELLLCFPAFQPVEARVDSIWMLGHHCPCDATTCLMIVDKVGRIRVDNKNHVACHKV
eukprot:4904597-Ditylum_brightwellii.AAC.2